MTIRSNIQRFRKGGMMCLISGIRRDGRERREEGGEERTKRRENSRGDNLHFTLEPFTPFILP